MLWQLPSFSMMTPFINSGHSVLAHSNMQGLAWVLPWLSHWGKDLLNYLMFNIQNNVIISWLTCTCLPVGHILLCNCKTCKLMARLLAETWLSSPSFPSSCCIVLEHGASSFVGTDNIVPPDTWLLSAGAAIPFPSHSLSIHSRAWDTGDHRRFLLLLRNSWDWNSTSRRSRTLSTESFN